MLFEAWQLEALFSRLGPRLPRDAKQLYILRAERSLLRAKEQTHRFPSRAENKVFHDIATDAARLRASLRRLARHPDAKHWIERAWYPVASSRPIPDNLPHKARSASDIAKKLPDHAPQFAALAATIDWLEQTALELLPTRRRGAPNRDDSTLPTLLLAHEYRATFAKLPTIGNTPFMRFMPEALQAIGCDPPGKERVARILKRIRGMPPGQSIDSRLAYSATRVF